MNTVPYTNARREGRTYPGRVEMIERGDPRHWSALPPVVPNRADLRARGVRGRRQASSFRSAAGRRVARPVCQHGTRLPFPWSTRTVYCQVCADEVTALLARQAVEAQARAAEQAKARGSRRGGRRLAAEQAVAAVEADGGTVTRPRRRTAKAEG